jgi:HK97 gp10 family phage protein
MPANSRGAAGTTVRLIGDKKLRRMLKDPKFVLGPAQNLLDSAANTVERLAKLKVPTDTGRLKNSITIDDTKTLERRVGTNVKYAKPVEFGTRPHFPPVESLNPWARRHGKNAWGVALKIAAVGTKPQPFMNPAIDEMESRHLDGFIRDFYRDVMRGWSI